MRKSWLAGWVLVLAGMAWGQVAAPPATQPSLSREQLAKWASDRKATNAQRVADNPDYMAIIKKVPKNLIPTKADTGPELQARMKSLRAWGVANLDGKHVRIEAFVEDGRKNAEFYLSGDPLNQYEVHPMVQGDLSAFTPGDKIIIEGTTGKGGSLLISANDWKEGDLFRTYHLLVLNATVTKAPAAPAAASQKSPPG